MTNVRLINFNDNYNDMSDATSSWGSAVEINHSTGMNLFYHKLLFGQVVHFKTDLFVLKYVDTVISDN